jgi:hypothetical protein
MQCKAEVGWQKEESASRDNFHDLHPVPGLEPAAGEFRRRHRFAVMFDHHAARQEFLRHEEFLDRARQARFDRLAVGDDRRRVHSALMLFDKILLVTVINPRWTLNFEL